MFGALTRRRRSLLTSACLGGVLLGTPAGCPGAAGAAEPAHDLDGAEVMRRVEESPRGSDLSARATWRLIDASGRERVRKTRIYRREARGEAGVRSQWLLVVDSPPDLKDTAFLVWNPRSPASEVRQWIHLAAFRKVKRVAAGDRGASFLGSDFSYEDLSEPPAADEEHVLVGTEILGGVSCPVVESIPKRTGGPYAKRVHWVDPSNWTAVRTDYYASSGELEKTLQASWTLLDGAWVTPRLEMRRAHPSRRTIIEAADFRIDTGLQAGLFDAAGLEHASRAP